MAFLAEVGEFPQTLDELSGRFGSLPLVRLRLNRDEPATEEDVVHLHEHQRCLCELIDGVLLEKTMGMYESYLTIELVHYLTQFVKQHKLGVVLGPDGMVRLWPGRVRVPDACFIPWNRLPGGRVPHVAMFDGAPELAVEVISPGNTAREMTDKLADYFNTGTRQVWYVYPQEQTVHVFASASESLVLQIGDVLEGGDVLPGFQLSLADLFADPPLGQG